MSLVEWVGGSPVDNSVDAFCKTKSWPVNMVGWSIIVIVNSPPIASVLTPDQKKGNPEAPRWQISTARPVASPPRSLVPTDYIGSNIVRSRIQTHPNG